MSNSRKRRRQSPTYDDYQSGGNDTSHVESGPSHYQSPSKDEFRPSIPFSRRYHARSQYNNDRRESDEEQLLRRQRSASPRQEKVLYTRTRSPSHLSRDSDITPAHRLSRSSPPPERAEPTDDYLLTSREHSRRLDDPAQSRKLLVLDLNGSLLLRSPHSRKAGQSRLRTVYPRPYLPAFRSYILHEETKRWLDVMIWSSAQPHSVHDMTDKCFHDRKKELRAIWARDTLGLNQDEYHRKTQTLKNLEKLWVEGDRQHSALTTVLVDDSPLKAALQPWNHLCIKEYLAEARSSDMGVADWEAKRRRLRQAREVLELEIRLREQAEWLKEEDEKRISAAVNNPGNTRVIREVAMVKGRVVGREQLIKKVTTEVVMVDGQMVDEHGGEGLWNGGSEKPSAKLRRRKEKRLAKKESMLKADEEATMEVALSAEIEEGEIDPTELEQEHESEEMKLEALAPKMKYDETLLAIIGILDQLKYESSVAGWLRHGGLFNVQEAEDASRLSNNPHGSPSKRRKLDPTDSCNGTEHTPATVPPSPQSGHRPPSPSKKRDEQVETDDISNDPPPPPPGLWFEQPAVMSYWTDRGRRALQALEIPDESGLTPVW